MTQISNAAWRAFLQPASFRGAGFKVEAGGKSGGRRNITHEFPERDTPFTEDMGRRVRRWREAVRSYRAAACTG